MPIHVSEKAIELEAGKGGRQADKHDELQGGKIHNNTSYLVQKISYISV